MDFQLRAGEPADDAACGSIMAAAGMASPLPERLPHAMAKWRDDAPLPAERCMRLVAERDGLIWGFADCDAERAHVRHLFVHPEVQGHGIASSLLNAIQLDLEGPITVHCPAVNDRALAWYLRQDFAISGGFIEELAGQPVVWIRLQRDEPQAD